MDRTSRKCSYIAYNCRNAADILECASVVKSGGIIVYPTDTVYGLGCDPYNERSVEKIFDIKGRGITKPMPILASTIADIEKIVYLDKTGRLLARRFWPGGLTIVSKRTDMNISSKISAGQKTLAVRIPNNRCTLSLLGECRYLVGTSANISGGKINKSPSDILSSELDNFDALLDGGILENGIESTIIEISDSKIYLIREGAIRLDEISRAIASSTGI
jgi:L-threonylcarbamoyladenylate synthase